MRSDLSKRRGRLAAINRSPVFGHGRWPFIVGSPAGTVNGCTREARSAREVVSLDTGA
jgi:hypothetical protein